MATPDAFEAAVGAVAPALNLRPEGFRGEGAPERVRRSGRPVHLTLKRGVSALCCHVGAIDDDSPDAAMPAAIDRALASLTSTLRKECRELVVAWEDADARAFAIALALKSERHELLASSWQAPHLWPRPSVDALMDPDQALEESLKRLVDLVAQDADVDALERELRVGDLALRNLGGEPLHWHALPADPAGQRTWVHHHCQSARDEARRARGHPATRAAPPASKEGPLVGRTIFVSYAKPDAATLAWPVRDALHALGATVWLDQEQALDGTTLNKGLADEIARCDSFVMCASDEYFERAGYANQELVWALQLRASRAGPAHFVVIKSPGTLLPTVVAALQVVSVQARYPSLLSATLLEALTVAAPHLDLGWLTRTAAPEESLPSPSPVADAILARLRAAHSQRFDQTHLDFKHPKEGNKALMQVAAGLDWSGRLADLDSWPIDAVIRDMRWRLGAMRVVRAVYWPLDGKLRDDAELVEDVQVLVHRRVPILEWSAVVGWAENERRYALRWHAGLLKQLQQLLRRGLYGGLTGVPGAKIDTWNALVVERRLECLDALIALRVEARLGWAADPPNWDRFFRQIHEILDSRKAAWQPAIPASVLSLLFMNRVVLAASMADQVWQVCRGTRHASQTLQLDSFGGTADGAAAVFAGDGDTLVAPPSVAGPGIAFGLITADSTTFKPTVAWRMAGADVDGKSTCVSRITRDAT